MTHNALSMDYEILRTENAQLFNSDLAPLAKELQVIDRGALMVCRRGSAVIHIGMTQRRLETDAGIILFPGDVVLVEQRSEDFMVELLTYDRAMLREASLQLEQTVYDRLRQDRFRGGVRIVFDILDNMFSLLKIYFRQEDCGCKDQLVLYQLKTFFLGYYDYLKRGGKDYMPLEPKSRRVGELFGQFMRLLESDFKVSQNVAYYAQKLNISPKYLNNIVRAASTLTPKTMIDHYVVLQIKLQLRTSDISIKQMAYEYHFSDASFFSRHFRRLTGMTPQEFREKYRNS